MSMVLRLQELRKRTYMLQALILQVLKKSKKRIEHLLELLLKLQALHGGM